MTREYRSLKQYLSWRGRVAICRHSFGFGLCSRPASLQNRSVLVGSNTSKHVTNTKKCSLWHGAAGAGLFVLLTLTGCATPMPKDERNYGATMPLPPTPVERLNGSLYHDNTSLVLFEDSRARRVGDILTIVLMEKTSATKSASTNTSKDSEMDFEGPTLFGRTPTINLPGKSGIDLGLGVEYDAARKFQGKGDSTLKNQLDGNLTVTVAEVLPNGYLVVRGEKRLTINQGNEFVRISGIIRPSDVQADNTVLSTLVADARITYTGDGDIHDSSQMGVLARFFNSLWPF